MHSRYIHRIVVFALIIALVSTPILAAAATDTSSTAAPTASSSGTPVEGADLTNRSDTEAWLDETIATQMETHHVPGAAVVIVHDGELFLAKGYGYAALGPQRPVVANETVFSVGSTGKLVTWTAVMQAVEDGTLDLDRDVNDYLTDSAVTIPDSYAAPVTLGHLGTHSAGFEDTFAGMVTDDPDKIPPMETVLAEHQPKRVRPPGQYVAYSNYGTALAGHVLAEQSNVRFTEYVDERIFTPLSMDDTTYVPPLPPRLDARSATGYTYQNGEYQPHDPVVWTLPPEGGSLRTTPTDMGQFMLAHLNEGTDGSARILEADTVREMYQRQFTKSEEVPELNGMAYGFIEMDRNGERIVGHWGTTPQFGSLLALYPEHDTGVFVVYNSPGGHSARFELLEAFTDRYYPQSDTPVVTPPAGAAERAQSLTGDYRSLTISESSWERVLGVMTRTYSVGSTDEGYLTTSRVSEETREWVERRPGVYDEVGGTDMLVFQLDDDGHATHMYRHEFGPATYERVPWYESLAVVQGVIATGVVAFVSVLVFLVGGVIRCQVWSRDTSSRRERATQWLFGAVSLLWLAVFFAFLLAWINFNAEAASPSLTLQGAKLLRYVALAGTVGTVVAFGVAWRGAYWTRWVRLYYAVVTVLALLFTWQLYLLRILPL